MIQAVAKVLLGPLLLAQGRRVRRTALKLPEPPGQRQGVVGQGQPLRLLVTGDSAAAGVGAESQDEGLLGKILSGLTDTFEVEYRLIAKTGAKTPSTIGRLARLDPVAYDVVVTSLGVNDLTSGTSSDEWISDQQHLINLLRGHFSAQQVIVAGLPPVGHFPLLPQPLRWYLGNKARRFDRALRQLTDDLDCDYIPMDIVKDQSLIAADGFHPGPKVYEMWGREVVSRIMHRHGSIPVSP